MEYRSLSHISCSAVEKKHRNLSVNVFGSDGAAPLHAAAELGLDDVTRILIAARANINATMHDGESALHIAARYWHRIPLVSRKHPQNIYIP